MTESTVLPSGPVTGDQIVAVLEARRQALLDEIDARIAAAVAPIEAALDAAIKVGDAISLTMDSGQVLSVDDGGPEVPGLPVGFSSKAEIAAWETFIVGKGQ